MSYTNNLFPGIDNHPGLHRDYHDTTISNQRSTSTNSVCRLPSNIATVVITRGFTLGSPIPEVLGKIIRLKMSQLSWWQRIFPLKTNISPENWWLVQMINFLSILLIVQKSNTSWNVFETLQIMGVQLPTSTGFLAGFQGVFLENPLLDALAVDLKGFFAYLQKLCNKIPGV